MSENRRGDFFDSHSTYDIFNDASLLLSSLTTQRHDMHHHSTVTSINLDCISTLNHMIYVNLNDKCSAADRVCNFQEC